MCARGPWAPVLPACPGASGGEGDGPGATDGNRGGAGREGPLSPAWRRRGRLWVLATLPLSVVAGTFTHSMTSYSLVLIASLFGAYVVPGIVVGHLAVTGAAPVERLGYRLLHVGLLVTAVIGAVVVVGHVTGWGWLLAVSPFGFDDRGGGDGRGPGRGRAPAVRRAGAVGRRGRDAGVGGGRRRPASPSLWWPEIVARPAPLVHALGRGHLPVHGGRRLLGGAAVGAPRPPAVGRRSRRWEVAAGAFVALVGTITAGLHVAQGVTAVALPELAARRPVRPVRVVVPAHPPARPACGSREGFAGAPPEDQVRGGWLPTAVPLLGIAALLPATAVAARDHGWAVPFAFAASSRCWRCWPPCARWPRCARPGRLYRTWW